MEWKPIDTAPTDGTRVLVWDYDGEECVIAVWVDYAWRIVDDGAVIPPSHWMPLPPRPPSLEAQAERMRDTMERVFRDAFGSEKTD